MTSNSFLIYAILSFFVACEVSCASESKDVARIIVNQCENCESSSYQYATIGSSEYDSKDTIQNIRVSVPISSYFFVIQVHSYLVSVLLSYDAEPTVATSVHGTNVGLNQFTHDKPNHTFYLFNNFTAPREVLIAVTSYTGSAPMPGGCNMEFNTKTAPYQHVDYNDALITVDVQSASLYQQTCDVQGNITLDFYLLFVNNGDLPVNGSYKAIIQMLTVKSIKIYGHKVIKPPSGPLLRRYFSNYQGFGVVYAVIATYGDASSAYVPSFTYGCNMQNGKESCFSKDKTTEWITMEVTTSISLFLLLSSFTAFLVPFFQFGYYATDAILMLIGIPYSPFIYIAIGAGVVLACLLGGCSKWFAIDNIILRLYAAHILTAVIYFGTATGDFELCQTMGYFWILYVALMIMMLVPVLDGVAKYINVCFHTVLMVDSLVGNGRLMYFNINSVRRAAVSNFYLASLYAPNPSALSIGCIILIGISYLISNFIKHCKGTRSVVGEATPLLG